jgi:hypothetical protein
VKNNAAGNKSSHQAARLVERCSFSLINRLSRSPLGFRMLANLFFFALK